MIRTIEETRSRTRVLVISPDDSTRAAEEEEVPDAGTGAVGIVITAGNPSTGDSGSAEEKASKEHEDTHGRTVHPYHVLFANGM